MATLASIGRPTSDFIAKTDSNYLCHNNSVFCVNSTIIIMSLTPEQAWQSVMGQLQVEMPKASFDTWVRDSQVVGFDKDVIRIGVRNSYACEWLESRLTSTINRLLIGILNQRVNVEFVVHQNDEEENTENNSLADEEHAEIKIVNRLPYDEIVAPSKVVAIPGYFSRLIPEIGVRNAWLYVGWRQAFWSASRGNKNSAYTQRVALKHVIRFSGLSRRTFFRAIEDESPWKALSGLVDREDTSPRWAQGNDHRSHRLPNRYTVHMTLRLSQVDSATIYEWLNERVQTGLSLLDALKLALQIKDLVGELLPPIGFLASDNMPPTYFQTVMDIAEALHESMTPELQEAAEALHRKIITGFGTILLTHYFLEKVIPRSGLTPAQAWLVALLRDRCYINSQTGEIRDEVLIHGGYAELASWLGLSRPKTVWEWIRNPVGPGGAFIELLPRHENDEFDALRMRIRLDEPVFMDGATDTSSEAQVAPMGGEIDTIKQGGPDTHSTAQLAPMEGGDGTQDWREWHSLKHLTTVPNTTELITSTTQTLAAAVLPSAWVLRKLLVQNHVHPKVTKELLSANASAQAFVSWVLFSCSPAGTGIDDPAAYAIASLREDGLLGAGGVFDRLAAKHPADFFRLLESAPKNRFAALSKGTGDTEWDSAMGLYNPKIKNLQKILLGE